MRRIAGLILVALVLLGLGGGAHAQPRPAPAAQPATQPAAAPPTAPFLRIEAGRHTAAVNRLATDAAGSIIATASDDKTVRLWNPEDGALRHVLRLPIGPREEGELYAVALTPDGKRAFAAGFTGFAWDRSFAIYLFDLERMVFRGRLPGLPAPVNHLAVSADGTRLAAGLGGNAGIRVWDAQTGRPVFQDTTYQGPVRMVAFDARGRLAASSADGKVRLYDQQGRKIAEAAPNQGGRPFGIAFSPDAGLIAVAYENRLRIDLLSARDLAVVHSPDVTGLSGEGLLAVAWSGDGRGGVQLYAGGYARGPEGYVLRRWGDFGLGGATDIPAARDAIVHLLPVPGHGLAYAALDPGWGRLKPDGTVALRPEPPIARFQAARDGRFALSADGYTVEFSGRARPLRFEAMRRSLSAAEAGGPALAQPRVTAPGVQVATWKDSNGPTVNGARLALGRGEFSRALAILPSNAGLLLGTDTHLRLFANDGRQLAEVATPGAAWAVNVSGDGTVAVAGLADGTLRWYGLVEGEQLVERAALYPHADGVRWVFFTPEGFFDHADAGGKEMVGVHLNRAAAQAPEWVTFAQAYRALYSPGLVRARLSGDAASVRARQAELGDIRGRLDRQPAVATLGLCTPIAGAGCLPLPPDAIRVPQGVDTLRVSVRLTDRGLGVGAVDVFVNDRNVGRSQPAGVVAGASVDQSVDVPLDPGANEIQLRVYDGENAVFLETEPILLVAPETGQQQGRLFVLAVGVDQYRVSSLNLRFAVADARTFAETVRANASSLFREVQVTSLFDAQATRANLVRELERLAREVRPQDTFFLYIAGHGVRSPVDDKFLFLPHDVALLNSREVVPRTAMDEATLIAALARIPARNGFLFMDTCYSGKITADALANVSHETGRFLLTASTEVQEALDSYNNQNGVFGHAVKEALSGRAARDDQGVISALAVGEYVARRVSQLAREKRHNQDAVFKSALRELRAFPVAQVRNP